MKKVIILDTNNWIYLSNGFNVYSNKHDELHLKVFEKIKKWTDQGSITFLTNDIIIEEWERNKSEASKQIDYIKRKCDSYSTNLDVIRKFIGYNPKELTRLKKMLDTEYENKVEKHRAHIREVEEFIHNSLVKIPVTDQVKIQAADRALRKEAPFVGEKKNSMADALLLLSALEYVSVNKTTISSSFFVSSNKGDFSSKESSEVIHPDLKPLLDKTNTEFFFTLGKLAQSIEEFLTIEELKVIEHANEPRYCDVCDYQLYPTVEFSQYLSIYNPLKGEASDSPDQMNMFELETEKNSEPDYEPNLVEIRTADCSWCAAEYIECVCGELVHIEEYNTPLECIGCGITYRANADIDRKGTIYKLDYEIIESYTCSKCGGEFEWVDEIGMCRECAEYERLANE